MYGTHPIDYMAMWEAFLDARNSNNNPSLSQTWLACGTVAMRAHAATVTKAADKLWQSLSFDQQDALLPFDWEFCPRFLALVQWSGDGRNSDINPQCPTKAEFLRAMIPEPAP